MYLFVCFSVDFGVMVALKKWDEGRFPVASPQQENKHNAGHITTINFTSINSSSCSLATHLHLLMFTLFWCLLLCRWKFDNTRKWAYRAVLTLLNATLGPLWPYCLNCVKWFLFIASFLCYAFQILRYQQRQKAIVVVVPCAKNIKVVR
jgi:hypothetical protein